MHKQNKKLLIVLIVSTFLLVGAATWWYFLRTPQRAQTTSKAATAQNDYHNGTPRSSSGSSPADQGGAIDTHGQVAGVPSGSQQIASKSGAITLFTPTAGTTIKSGDIIAGEAHVSIVNYRLVDNEVGVVAQGQLSVVNGKYSGKLQFTAHGANGKLDIFSYDSSTGAEVNNIDISVNY